VATRIFHLLKYNVVFEKLASLQNLIQVGLREIFRLLFEAGTPGLLPKDLAVKLEEFKVTRHQVSRRILRMNKRLEKEFGESAVEKRGWHWALTGFIIESWGETERNFKRQMLPSSE
jgi:hypothetical protein